MNRRQIVKIISQKDVSVIGARFFRLLNEKFICLKRPTKIPDLNACHLYVYIIYMHVSSTDSISGLNGLNQGVGMYVNTYIHTNRDLSY